MHGVKKQTTVSTETRKERKETSNRVESYLRQLIHGGAVSGEASTLSPRTTPPPKLSGDPRAASQQTLSQATPPSEGEKALSPGLLRRRGDQHTHQRLY